MWDIKQIKQQIRGAVEWVISEVLNKSVAGQILFGSRVIHGVHVELR